jgi:hypothetical protein
MGLLVHLVFFCFYLLVWGINIVKGFTTFSATVLALTFVFGNSARSVFEVRDLPTALLAGGHSARSARRVLHNSEAIYICSVMSSQHVRLFEAYLLLHALTRLPFSVLQSAIFLFVEHPYDVGDLLGMPDTSMARVKKVSRAGRGSAHAASSPHHHRVHSRPIVV